MGFKPCHRSCLVGFIKVKFVAKKQTNKGSGIEIKQVGISINKKIFWGGIHALSDDFISVVILGLQDECACCQRSALISVVLSSGYRYSVKATIQPLLHK